ncbi:hypothetical protein [Burkholderia multivorans]|uniref:hypothetical protein n=1 Tax=Burkholderia multivorans TaxID=87883 RepID=UPI001C255D81|nr:hypothetical protein [Burkholderia multivorans]MBU9576754.1 hypothetical protein [Burkholderia multivorans]
MAQIEPGVTPDGERESASKPGVYPTVANEVAQQRERQIAQWEVRSVEFTYPAADTSLLASRTLTLFNKASRREVRIPLGQADAFQKTALMRVPEKLPAEILALADTPEAAYERWVMARRRGYLAGGQKYVRTI